jgi:hypothetical protein
MIQMDHDLKARNCFSQPEEGNVEVKQESLNDEPEEDQLLWDRYGTKAYPDPAPEHPKPISKVRRKCYCEHGFMETPTFWDDMLNIGSQVCKVPLDRRNRKLSKCLMEMNTKLPANVYIPFFKEEIRLYTILCVWKGRLFSTNTRAPYSIWVEMYREQEELNL